MNTVDAFVDHLSFSLGDDTYSVEESAQNRLTVSPAPHLRAAGFAQHHICRNDTTAYDLAYRAIEPIRDALSDIGAIVYATCLPINGSIGDSEKYHETKDVKYLMDFPVSHLQCDFGLEKAIVIGLNQQACTGVLGSLRLAKMLLLAEPDLRRVLCVTADRFPAGALYEQAYNLISDGAAACVVSTTPRGFRLLAAHAITNGALSQASDDETVGNYFSYTYRIIQETLAKARLTIDDIDWIVPQNTNIKAWQILSRLLKYDFAKVFFPTLTDVGHVISGDNIINLKYLTEQARVRPGERVLLFMAGYGLNWQCVLLEYTQP